MRNILFQTTNKWINKHGHFPQENNPKALTCSVAWEVNKNGYINLFTICACPTPPLTTITLLLPLSRRTALTRAVDEELGDPRQPYLIGRRWEPISPENTCDSQGTIGKIHHRTQTRGLRVSLPEAVGSLTV